MASLTALQDCEELGVISDLNFDITNIQNYAKI